MIRRCRKVVGVDDGNSRIQNKIDEEEACSEFLREFLSVVQS